MNCDTDGLTAEDFAWAYPMRSECATLGHPVVRLPDGERFADYHLCICHRMEVSGGGETAHIQPGGLLAFNPNRHD